MTIRDEFGVHILNDSGIAKAREIAEVYSRALVDLEALCGADGREMAIVKTKLQESAFFAKRAMAVRPENQR